ncbi:GIY-YIG nuclease family protein [Tessaracoccus sp. MC1679]|uniref:GIY-YIG nuclease family protein n=1 Tax=Tessaracoccus sp. MC1679 TaxID=2760313 RepID=UPI001602AE8C|nr:GIY-YIG nuclease family protein [Tessaracoccus sp. MC1679]
MTNRIYVYTVVGKDTELWERTEGSQLVTGAGLLKVGQTTKGTARARIRQQLNTAYPGLKGVTILLDEPATRANGPEFSDHDVHSALVAAGINRTGGEWFEATLDEVKAAVQVVRSGIAYQPKRTQSFTMRPEQQAAVDLTAAYFRNQAGSKAPKFLWNAKMRFGKTFTTYQLAKEMGWQRVLVLTFKPAVATAWHDDLVSHVDFDGWRYIDKESSEAERDDAADYNGPVVWFASLQDLGGRDSEGNIKVKNEVIHLIDWDAIVLDEYHFGAWRDSARALYDPADKDEAEADEPDEQVTADDLTEELEVKAKHYLYLSGTPFRAITDGEFTEDAIFNWTYVDEQREKTLWPDPPSNPYITLPQMQMYSYDMGKEAADYAEDGEFSGFSLNEFFKAQRLPNGTHEFERPDEVGEFLEMLRGKLSDQMKLQVLTQDKPPFPFEAVRFKSAVKHSVWYMNNVAACFAMAEQLERHPYFSQFEIVIAAGNKAGQGVAALPPVERAIEDVKKGDRNGSITLSCGKLMTGITVREWGAILMLRSLKSPESYFQAAFRVQSPWSYRDAEGNLDLRKTTCYVFEFDPNRALSLVAEYGSKLATTGDTTPSQAIGELINYLPIFGFTGGAMTPLDATAVLDWASAGVGAAALARRWNSPLLVDVNEHTLASVLAQPALLEALENVEDFRALVDNAQQVITNTKDLKKAKREQGGKLTPDQKKTQSETAKRRAEIREKLQKFLAKIPVFMYTTDYREEALKHVIESLDSVLFERVTGLSVDDFKSLSDLGLFNAQHLNHAIYQFKRFESASLDYALTENERERRHQHEQIGLWDTVTTG